MPPTIEVFNTINFFREKKLKTNVFFHLIFYLLIEVIHIVEDAFIVDC